MASFDGKALGEAIVANVREFVSKALTTLSARCDDLDVRLKGIPAGPKGDPGERGADGPNGKDGEHGIHGRDGAPGKDADPALIADLVAAEVAKAVAALPPAKDGEPGKDAESIHPDTIALMVVNEVAKAVAAIPLARDGKDGLHGRDAVELPILPFLEEGKEYPQGTYARHAGGIVKTTGRGWEVMVNGVQSATVEAKSDREFDVCLTMTDGEIVRTVVKMPVMIYRGIWKDGEYERGDCTTRDGSVWHCEVEKTVAAPGTSNDWKLAVKKGTHGKDGIGKEGPPGKPGKDGKDRY